MAPLFGPPCTAAIYLFIIKIVQKYTMKLKKQKIYKKDTRQSYGTHKVKHSRIKSTSLLLKSQESLSVSFLCAAQAPILDHTSCRTVYIQLGKDIALHKISVNRCMPMQRQVKTHTAQLSIKPHKRTSPSEIRTMSRNKFNTLATHLDTNISGV